MLDGNNVGSLIPPMLKPDSRYRANRWAGCAIVMQQHFLLHRRRHLACRFGMVAAVVALDHSIGINSKLPNLPFGAANGGPCSVTTVFHHSGD
jgi:hypothetical protein